MRLSLHKIALSATLAMSWAYAEAEIPAGYYSKLEGKTGAELKNAVHEVIYPHTEVSSYSALPQYFQHTDARPNPTPATVRTEWWDMYSNVVRYIPSFSGLNREHAFPKSWWKENGSVEYTPAYVDLNHLYPADGPANHAKSNWPLGVTVPNPTSVKGGFDNGVSQIGYPVAGQGAGAKFVFEPADEYKGDFARTYFYMVTCYQNLHWNSSYMWMLEQNDYPTLTPWALNLLLQWHRDDKVSQKEIDRNEVVFGYQNNRNPFIDFPDLAEYIWGNKVGESFSPGTATQPTGKPTLLAPTPDMYLDFGEVAVGKSTSSYLLFKGENLKGTIDLNVGKYPSGTDFRKMFTLPEKSINTVEVNKSTGYYVKVDYTPAVEAGTEIPAEGVEHTARILISGGGLEGTSSNTFVYLRGRAFPEPVLSRLEAYAPSDISSDSYKATWSEAPEVIDYYLFTRVRTIGGQQIVETIECEDNYVIIDDFDASDSESYYVQSSRLGYLSPESNVEFVSRSGISDIEEDRPLSVESYAGSIRIRCVGSMTNGRVIDTMGRTVMFLPEIVDGMEINLSYGIYFLVTDEHSTPVKMIAR